MAVKKTDELSVQQAIKIVVDEFDKMAYKDQVALIIKLKNKLVKVK